MRTEQPRFLAAEGDERDRARGRRARRELTRHLEHDRDAARVVAGAGVQLADRIAPRVRPAVAEMIVVGAQDGHLVLELRVRAGQHGDHVAQLGFVLVDAAGGLEGLEPAAGVAAGLEARGCELLSNIVAGGDETGAVEAAAFALRCGEVVDVALQPFRGVHSGRLGERRAARQRGQRNRRARLAKIHDERRIRGRPLTLGDVSGLGAFEYEPGILAVMGQLAAEAGDRFQRVGREPADSELRVLRVTAREDVGVASEGELLAADADAAGVDLQAEGGLTREQLRGEPVLPAEQPHAAVRRQLLDAPDR